MSYLHHALHAALAQVLGAPLSMQPKLKSATQWLSCCKRPAALTVPAESTATSSMMPSSATRSGWKPMASDPALALRNCMHRRYHHVVVRGYSVGRTCFNHLRAQLVLCVGICVLHSLRFANFRWCVQNGRFFRRWIPLIVVRAHQAQAVTADRYMKMSHRALGSIGKQK